MQNMEVMDVIYVKFMSNIRRAQRALSPFAVENHIQGHIHAESERNPYLLIATDFTVQT